MPARGLQPDAAFLGIVRGHTGPNTGPATDIDYKVLVNFPDGAQEVTGIAPAVQRWSVVDVDAIQTGTAVWIASVKGQLQLMHRELPHVDPCPSAGGSVSGGGGGMLQAFLALPLDQKMALAAALKEFM